MPEAILSNPRILIIDDQRANIRLIASILEAAGYTNVRSVQDSRKALDQYHAFEPDLIVLDLHMPHLDGLEVLRQVRISIPQDEYVPILVLAAETLPAIKQQALAMGAKDFLTKPFDVVEVRLRIRNLLEARFLYVQLRVQNQTLDAKVSERTRELEMVQYEMLERLARASDSRDDETGQHTHRVGALAAALAHCVGHSKEECSMIARAAALHDVGKIGISDSILQKPGKLTPEEFACMKTHTVIGAQILTGSHFPLIQLAEQIALHHHEKWDGSGYMGLKGEEIPPIARIVSIADVYDVLTHSRPYKEAWPVDKARAEVQNQSGRAFDPRLVEVFIAEIWRQDLANLSAVVSTPSGVPANVLVPSPSVMVA